MCPTFFLRITVCLHFYLALFTDTLLFADIQSGTIQKVHPVVYIIKFALILFLQIWKSDEGFSPTSP